VIINHAASLQHPTVSSNQSVRHASVKAFVAQGAGSGLGGITICLGAVVRFLVTGSPNWIFSGRGRPFDISSLV